MIAGHERRSDVREEYEMSWRPKTYGKMLIAIFLLWQVSAVLHLALALHTLCPEHGAVAHTDCETGELEHHPDVPFTNGDDCFVLVALATNGGMPDLALPVADPPESYLLEPKEARAESVVLPQRDRFRLAPSHSPPFFAA